MWEEKRTSPKSCTSRRSVIDQEKLIGIINRFKNVVGKHPDNWSMKKEWREISMLYCQTKTTRTLRKIRALYDCYHNFCRLEVLAGPFDVDNWTFRDDVKELVEWKTRDESEVYLDCDTSKNQGININYQNTRKDNNLCNDECRNKNIDNNPSNQIVSGGYVSKQDTLDGFKGHRENGIGKPVQEGRVETDPGNADGENVCRAYWNVNRTELKGNGIDKDDDHTSNEAKNKRKEHDDNRGYNVRDKRRCPELSRDRIGISTETCSYTDLDNDYDLEGNYPITSTSDEEKSGGRPSTRGEYFEKEIQSKTDCEGNVKGERNRYGPHGDVNDEVEDEKIKYSDVWESSTSNNSVEDEYFDGDIHGERPYEDYKRSGAMGKKIPNMKIWVKKMMGENAMILLVYTRS